MKTWPRANGRPSATMRAQNSVTIAASSRPLSPAWLIHVAISANCVSSIDCPRLPLERGRSAVSLDHAIYFKDSPGPPVSRKVSRFPLVLASQAGARMSRESLSRPRLTGDDLKKASRWSHDRDPSRHLVRRDERSAVRSRAYSECVAFDPIEAHWDSIRLDG